MTTWIQYSQIKLLIDQYWALRDREKYDEFIKQLIDVLGI